MAEHLWFWLIDLIIPGLLLATGAAWRRFAPRRIDPRRGYRTARSTANGVAWRYAQRYFSALCLRFGTTLLLLVSADRLINLLAGLMPPARLAYLNTAVGLGLFLSIVPLVELALAGRFDGRVDGGDTRAGARPLRPAA